MTPKNMDQLFIHLALRLHHYPEAAVLWALIREWADDQEYKTSAWRIAITKLDGTINEKTAQRAFHSLEEKGLIQVRIHKKTATRITVNRDAVLDLLEDGEEFDPLLPGQFTGEVGFLQAWNERLKAKAEAAAAKAESEAAAKAASEYEQSMISTKKPVPSNDEVLHLKDQASDYDNH